MVVFYQQPNYERFQVASDECTISRKTDSLYRRKRREQSMLHVKRVTLELRIPEGISLRGRCVRGIHSRSYLSLENYLWDGDFRFLFGDVSGRGQELVW